MSIIEMLSKILKKEEEQKSQKNMSFSLSDEECQKLDLRISRIENKIEYVLANHCEKINSG